MILFLSNNDWANVGYVFAECLKRVGVDAGAVKLQEHAFKYPESAVTVRVEDLQGVVDSADTVVLMHSDPYLLSLEVDYSGKRLGVFHGGSQYRQEPNFISRLFNGVVDFSITQTGDLLNLGAKNEHWVMPCIDVHKYAPDYSPQNAFTIGHFPRAPLAKGTYIINRAMRDYPFFYLHAIYNVSWKENLERVKRCDVYIDAMQPVLHGKTYGEWGVQALEAAAIGKVVFSHHLTKKAYERAFGECPIVAINNEGDLRRALSELPYTDLEKRKRDTRAWVEKFHSYEATGERLKTILT